MKHCSCKKQDKNGEMNGIVQNIMNCVQERNKNLHFR